MIGVRPPKKSLGGLVVFAPKLHLLIGVKPPGKLLGGSLLRIELRVCTLVIGYQARLGSLVFAPKTPD